MNVSFNAKSSAESEDAGDRQQSNSSAPRDLIYVLRDPDTLAVRYVGKTSNPVQRMAQHGRDARCKDRPLHRWWNERAQAGQDLPVMSVVASSIGDDWEDLERLLIAQYRADGADLLNVAMGGRAPFLTPEQRAERGKACAKAVHSDPVRRRVWEMKKEMGAYLAKLEREGRHERLAEMRAKLAVAAAKSPELWGKYA